MAELTDFEKRLKEYERDYKLGDLNASNDKATLYALIQSELILEKLQKKMTLIIDDEDLMKGAQELKRLSDLTRDTINNITSMQRTLAIDRKTRQDDQQQSTADYINSLKRVAAEWLDKQFIKVYCPNCKIMVTRILPVHEFTAFTVATECSQCGKSIRAQRQGKDIFFDVKNADWRRKHPVEIVQATKSEDGFEISDALNNVVKDDVVIEHIPDTSVQIEPLIPKNVKRPKEDLVIGEKPHGID